WDRGVVNDTWEKSPEMKSQEMFHYFPAKLPVEAPKKDKKLPKLPTDPKAIDLDPTLTPEQKIIAKYGNPDEKPTITPVENAPKPFKGMLEALNAGDDKLAYRFAKQYMRLTHQLSQLGGRVGSLTNAAKIAEGLDNDTTGSARTGSSVTD